MQILKVFDHLADVAALLLKVLKLLPKHSHLGVKLVPLSLQPAFRHLGFLDFMTKIGKPKGKHGDLEPAHILTLVRHSE